MRWLADALIVGFLGSLIVMGTAIAEAVATSVNEADLLRMILDPETGITVLSLVIAVVSFRGWREEAKGRREDAQEHLKTLLEREQVWQKVVIFLDRLERKQGG